MGMLAWVIMGLALWHFTIWLPDRFWGGIVGAFLASIVGAIVSGIVISARAARHRDSGPARHPHRNRAVRDPGGARRHGARHMSSGRRASATSSASPAARSASPEFFPRYALRGSAGAI